MRLLVCSNTYPPFAMGGYELLCEEHVAWLRAQGCEVTVLTSRFGLGPGAPAESTGNAGERVRRALDLHWRNFAHHRPNLATTWTHERRQRRAVDDALAEARPQACLVWGMGAISKSVLASIHEAGVPMVAVIGEHWPIWDVESDGWARLWRRPGLRRLSGWAGRTFAPTDVDAAMRATTPLYASAQLRDAVEAGVPAWRGRGSVVSNGIRAERFARPEPRPGALPSPLRLLYAGRVEQRKGAATAVAALPAIGAEGVDATLTLVGWRDEVFASGLRRTAAALGVADRVEFRDPVPRDEMPAVYHEHDVLLFPALWNEPFGLVPLEAMAAGCCVVATGTGGSAEYLEDGANSLLFERGDEAGLARAVTTLARDADLVARLRAGGAATAARHGFDEYAQALFAHVQDATGRSRPRAEAPTAATLAGQSRQG